MAHIVDLTQYREARKPALRGQAAVAAHFARFAASGAAWRFDVDDVIADL